MEKAKRNEGDLDVVDEMVGGVLLMVLMKLPHVSHGVGFSHLLQKDCNDEADLDLGRMLQQSFGGLEPTNARPCQQDVGASAYKTLVPNTRQYNKRGRSFGGQQTIPS